MNYADRHVARGAACGTRGTAERFRRAGCPANEQADADTTHGREAHLMPPQLVPAARGFFCAACARSWRSGQSAQTRLDKLVIRHRLQHGGGSLLDLSAPRRQGAGAVRHRRPEPRGRPPHAPEGRRGPGRPGREIGRAGEPVGRARRSAFLLSAGNRRRPVQVVPGRAHRARRPGVRRAHRAEHGRARHYDEEEVEALQPRSPWCWPKSWRKAASSISPRLDEPELSLDRPAQVPRAKVSPKASRSGRCSCTSRASRSSA